jgi:hypothetical protein
MLPVAGVMTMLTTQAFAGPLTLTCAPAQRAVLRETLVRGEPVTRATCVDTEVAYQAVRPVRHHVRPHRSWGKTALTIAGGGATGAGIGGLVNGKKGSLIGAALGGGSAAIYESLKRR